MSFKITTLKNGDVKVDQDFFDGQQMDTLSRVFTQSGAYVYQVFPNGATSQICEGLRSTGPTLHGGDDLADVIKNTLA